jgi:hypothetical protein
MTQHTYSDESKCDTKTVANTTDKIEKPIKRAGKKQKDIGVVWFEGPYNTVRGETALWVAVITQAMMDALNRSKNAEALYHKNEALQWLTGNSKDFHLVCMHAGMDPDYVRRKAKRSLVSPVAWRAAPGKGKRYYERRAYRQRLKEKTKAPPSSAEPGDNVLPGPWASPLLSPSN